MSLLEGRRIGPYEIATRIGAGGMGAVYKAIDTRLNRTVAVKVLPRHLAADPPSRARLEREAHAVAALNHPHICTLYDIGSQDGIDFLVLEYLEGETLASRLLKGPLPIARALEYATQIASAIDVAHRAGIVHRDLKPGNVMLTKAGVKLLDFGLAKALSPIVMGESTRLSPGPDLTTAGTILGTLQYMAPEQIEGKAADARTDIFAFGAVLFEMLTGRKAFEADNQASLIAAILEREPQRPSSLSLPVPVFLDRVVQRCLAKDPERRWQSARDVVLELESPDDVSSPSASEAPPAAGVREWRGWVAAAGLLVALVAQQTPWFRSAVEEPTLSRLSILPPENTAFLGGFAAPYFALSPDGTSLAFVPTPIGGRTLLWIRAIDSLDARPLAGTDGATFPFWSPDNRMLAFFADGKLKAVDVRAGTPHVICDAPEGRGGTWSRDGTMVFAQVLGPLYRVAASGGEPAAVTTLDASRLEASHRLPSFLPDGTHFLFFAQSGKPEHSTVYIGSLDATQPRALNIRASRAVYAPPGYVLYVRDGTLIAQGFNLSRLELSGDPVPVGQPVASRTGIQGDWLFSAADVGSLVYWSGQEGVTELTWFNRTGEPIGTVGKPGDHLSLDLSRDEKKVAVELVDPTTHLGHIWVIDLANGIRSRVTLDPAWDFSPWWSPDGTRIVFASTRGGVQSLYLTSTIVGGADELLLKSDDAVGPTAWSFDNRFIVYQNMSKNRVGVLPLTGERSPKLLLQTGFVEGNGQLSPDGRWLAYTSNESGNWDVYVQPFPALDRKWRVSPDGGSHPRWRSDGKELFYVAKDQRLMAVSITDEPSFTASAPTALFQLRLIPVQPTLPRQQYAVSATGDRFLVNTVSKPTVASPVTVVLNWTAAVKTRH